MIHYIHTLSTVLVENLTERATIRDADASNVINKFSLLEERLSRADVWMTFYKNTSNFRPQSVRGDLLCLPVPAQPQRQHGVQQRDVVQSAQVYPGQVHGAA